MHCRRGGGVPDRHLRQRRDRGRGQGLQSDVASLEGIPGRNLCPERISGGRSRSAPGGGGAVAESARKTGKAGGRTNGGACGGQRQTEKGDRRTACGGVETKRAGAASATNRENGGLGNAGGRGGPRLEQCAFGHRHLSGPALAQAFSRRFDAKTRGEHPQFGPEGGGHRPGSPDAGQKGRCRLGGPEPEPYG